MRWSELLPEPNDGSPPIPPAIGLRERIEPIRSHLALDQLRLTSGFTIDVAPISGSPPGRVRGAEKPLCRQETRIEMSWIRPLYEACSVPEARIERRRK